MVQHKRTVLKTTSRTCFPLVALLLLFTITARAQTEVIKFPKTHLTVREVFAEIQSQSNYGTAYNGRLFDAGREINLSSSQLTLDRVMKQILEGTGFSYTINKNVISITKNVAEPAKAVVVKPITDDVYRRSNLSDFSTQPNRRPAKTVEVQEEAQHEQSDVTENHEFTSRAVSFELYAANRGTLPRFALKSNLLYGFGTLTPNLALEIGLNERTSLELSGSYNPWKLSGNFESNKKLVHMILRAEYRYWLCERYNGHFFAVDAIYGRYNIGSVNVPLLFKKEHRYDGYAVGGGMTYGYHLMLSKRWGVEFKAGVGVMRLNYDKYNCVLCDRDGVNHKKTYFMPTNAGINLVWLIK